MSHRIGIYVRVSTEEQAQVVDGSIDSQQHRLKFFIEFKNGQEKNWGKVVETYIDDGYSAKDTKRPAYQRMMKDIHAGKVNLILVTDISRLSRNIADFCLLLKDLEERKAKFFSAKEQFDTSTPAGEMMIYNMINLAQFERKQTSERVSINFHSRALRGLLNNGVSMLGFEKDPTNSGKLIVIKEEVAHAQKIFKEYLKNSSIQATANFLNDNGIKPKATQNKKQRHVIEGRWTVGSIRSVLTNLAYIGKREVNRMNKDEDQGYLKPWQRYQIVDASWKGIIDEEDFYLVQKLLEENKKMERTRLKGASPKFYLLSGIIRCGECDRALIGQTSHGKTSTHRYYGHKKVVGETIACKYARFRADDIEEVVIQHLNEILLQAGHLDTVAENIRKTMNYQNEDSLVERDSIQKELNKIESDIESIFSLFADMGKESQGANLVKDKLEKLADKKRKLTNYKEEVMAKLEKSNDIKKAKIVIADNALAFKNGWKKANPTTKKRLLRNLVDKLIYSGDGLHTLYVLAKDNTTTVLEKKLNGASEILSEAYLKAKNVLNVFTGNTTGMNLSDSASVVRNGGPLRDRTAHLNTASVALYQLS
jgi:site-specific DNA recombinase